MGDTEGIGLEAGVREILVRHEGLAPARLIRLETGSGFKAGEFLLDVGSIVLLSPRLLGFMVRWTLAFPFGRNEG